MAELIRPEISVDPDYYAELAREYLRANVPGWESADGNLDEWLIEAGSQFAAVVAETAVDAMTDDLRWRGPNLYGVPPIEAIAASGEVTFTLNPDELDAPDEIPAGFTVAKEVDGRLVSFETTEATPVAAAATTAAAVPVVANVEGGVGNDLTGALVVIDSLVFVTATVFDAPTGGGSDAEEDTRFLGRLVEELRSVGRPVLPEDFSTRAKRIPETERALTIDGYNPDDDTYDNERMVTVFSLRDDGEWISAPSRAATDILFNGNGSTIRPLREVTFAVHIGEPTYTTVDVDFDATAWPGHDPAVVEADAITAVQSYLYPGMWGQPLFGDERVWENEDTIRLGELYTVLNNVDGLRNVTALTFAAAGDPLDDIDVVMGGPAPLPRAGAITGDVVAS